MKNTKILKIAFGSTLVVCTAIVVPALCITAALNKKPKVVNNPEYKPLTIKQDCLNSNTIICNTNFKETWLKTHAVDCRNDDVISEILKTETSNEKTACTWYTKMSVTTAGDKEHAMNDPNDDGIVVVNSTNTSTSGLSWNIPNVGKEDGFGNLKNNSTRIWYVSTDPTKQRKKIEFSNDECGSTLYFLVSAANLSDDSAKLTVTCNYSDGKSSTDTFTVEDWNKASADIDAAKFYRAKGTGYGTTVSDYGVDRTEYHLSQCSVKLDPTKVLKDITIECGDKTTSGATNQMVMTIYGITCLTTGLPTPTGLTATMPTKQGVTLSWTAPTKEVVRGYKLDIAEDADFETYVEGLKDIKIASNRTANTYTITSGLKPYKTYYARIRSIDATEQQSQNSNVVSFTTKDTDATEINVLDLVKKVEFGNNHSFKVDVIGETIGGETFKPQDQTIVFDLTTEQQEYITARYNTETQKYELTVSKCGVDEKVNFHSNATPNVTSSVELTTTPLASDAITVKNVHDKDFTITWDDVENADGYKITVKTDGGQIVQDWNKKLVSKESATSGVTISGLIENTDYIIEVWTVSNNTESQSCCTNHTTTKWTEIPTPYPDPSGVKSNKIKFYWNKIHDAEKYIVQAYTVDEEGVEHTLFDTLTKETTNTSYDVGVSKVKVGTTIYFKVQGVINSVEKGWSEAATYVMPNVHSNNSFPSSAIGGIVGGTAAVGLAVSLPVGLVKYRKNKKI